VRQLRIMDRLFETLAIYSGEDTTLGNLSNHPNFRPETPTLPKRLLNITTMKVELYENIANIVEKKGYACVSHVWGNQRKEYTAEEIGVTGIDWMIPLSTLDKISMIKDAMAKHEMEYCWFDVLCMNQDRQEEVSLEIPLMGDYYNWAKITFVLSDIDYEISPLLERWCIMAKEILETKRPFSDEEFSWMDASYGMNLLDISKDKWFTRVWTYQEAVLSKRLVLVGSNMSYLELTDIILDMSRLYSRNLGYALILFPNSNTFLNLGGIMSAYNENKHNLENVLAQSMSRDCYKPHDRFFAILGILGYRSFVVDYAADIDDVNKGIICYAHSKGDLSYDGRWRRKRISALSEK
jgi:hypothetical protein